MSGWSSRQRFAAWRRASGETLPVLSLPIILRATIKIQSMETYLLQLSRRRTVLPFQQWQSYLFVVIYTSSSSFEHTG